MKIAPAVQSELVRAVVVTIVAGGIVWAGKRFFDKVAAKVSSIADIPSAVLESATQAIDEGVAKVKDVAVKGGQAAKEKYQVNPRADDLKSNFEPKYNSPMVNDQGMDFTLF